MHLWQDSAAQQGEVNITLPPSFRIESGTPLTVGYIPHGIEETFSTAILKHPIKQRAPCEDLLVCD